MWPVNVIARIEGGLGNQMFQYAAARSLADRLGCDLLLDLRTFNENLDRPFQLNLYRIRAVVATHQQLQRLPHWRTSRLGRVRSWLSQFAPSIFMFPVFWPRTFAFDPRFEKITHPAYLVGYWQSEKYFIWNRSRLLGDFQLRAEIPLTTPYLSEIKNTCSVALHIRRGDYITNPAAAKFHGLCTLEYYYAAIELLKVSCPDMHVFVFSDEPSWAKANLQFKVPTIYVDTNTGEKDYIDLELMRHCRHHVIANSSFSWWGAWRVETGDQMVYAPQVWFSDSNVDTSDVLPDRWRFTPPP
jgi:hypothetical protein